MLQRKPVFPNVIEMNYQAGERLGCNVYLVFDGAEWVLIDISRRVCERCTTRSCR
jgi:hypothetical protein